MKYPKYVDFAMRRLEAAGESAFVVGGSVRDYLLGHEPSDFDIATSSLPDRTLEIFQDMRVIETGIKHGTVTVLVDSHPLEITTFRTDGDYTDSRHPDSVSFTSDIRADLSRRDFTVNAMAYSPRTGLVDIFGGEADLRAKIIRTVGDARTRFSEDALRIMRAFRFSAQLGFKIERETLEGARECRELLSGISRERIGVEFVKLLTSEYARGALEKMAELDILSFVIGKHLPSRDIIEKLEYMPRTATARLGFLLCEAKKEEVFKILEGLRLSTKLIRGSAAVMSGALCRVETRREAGDFLMSFGSDSAEAICGSVLLGNSPERAKDLVLEWNSLPHSIGDLAISGRELLELGVRGVRVGEILSALLDFVMEQPDKNTKEALLLKAKKMIEN